jgi:hypothetical protein
MPVSASRLALLRVYAALDHLRRPTTPEHERLDASLRVLGVDVDELGDPGVELERFAEEIRQERAEAREEPPIPLISVVETAMDVLAAGVDVSDETLRTLTAHVVEEQTRDDPKIVADVVEALRIASEQQRTDQGDQAERWPAFQREAQARNSPLIEEVRGVRRRKCKEELFRHNGEWATRIETYFEIDHGTYDLDGLANACMPPNWHSCNNFFCSLDHCPDRDHDCPGSTPGTPPRPGADYWRTVFEEKVLLCPDGVFPDTFLLFTWTRRPSQLILEYELVPRRPGDRTVLTLDQGYLQVDKLSTTYSVTTVKKLLFDHAFLPSGGQTLAEYACEIGWLDYSITQFTECGKQFPPVPHPRRGGGAQQPGDSKTRLLDVVEQWERELRALAEATVTDIDECFARLRAGDRGLDEHFAVAAQKVATRAARHGSSWVTGQLDYALASLDLAGEFADNRRRSRGWS